LGATIRTLIGFALSASEQRCSDKKTLQFFDLRQESRKPHDLFARGEDLKP
jgi:hypothetical protein